MIGVDEALALVLDRAPAPQAEVVPLDAAAGRWLLQDARSRMTQPPFDAAAMDGYAVRAGDGPGPLTVVGQSAAGAGWPGVLAPGQAVRIFTGAPVPQGADRAPAAGVGVGRAEHAHQGNCGQGAHANAEGHQNVNHPTQGDHLRKRQ